MSLRDHPPVPARVGRRRRIEEILEALPLEDAEALGEWLADLRFSPTRIAAEIRVEGYEISDSAIAKYRHEVLGLGDRKR